MERERKSIVPRLRAGWRRTTGGLIGAAPLFIFAITLSSAIALSGCWPFNRTPPQQEYFNALKIGNSAQASQIWLHMTPDERAKFGRGENIRPSVSSKDAQQAIDEHYADQDDDGSANKQVEPAPGSGAGLQDLPSYLNANGGAGVTPSAPADR
jgi:hypothetical protein